MPHFKAFVDAVLERCFSSLSIGPPSHQGVVRERNGFCLWLKRLEAERFKTAPDASDEAIILTVQELNWLLDGFDLWRNRPHQVLTPRFVA